MRPGGRGPDGADKICFIKNLSCVSLLQLKSEHLVALQSACPPWIGQAALLLVVRMLRSTWAWSHGRLGAGRGCAMCGLFIHGVSPDAIQGIRRLL
jgi:hypothetical protein